MKKTFLLLPLAAIALASCGTTTSTDTYEIKTISPAGAPTLAFYDQGANSNFQTDSTPANVAKQLLGTEYDAVVFDSINGLNSIKNKGAEFKLARFITGGNFFVVSYDEGDAVPSSSEPFTSFGEGLLPDAVMKKLFASYWTTWALPETPTYLSGVSDVQKSLLTKTKGFYFIAQPALAAAKANLGDDASKLKVLSNVRTDWKAYSGQSFIPQAALFIRNSTYSNHSTIVSNYLSYLDNRLTITVDNPEVARNAIVAWSDVTTSQVAKFGFPAAIAYNVQKDGANGLGMIKPGIIGNNLTFVNTFIEKLGSSTYSAYDSTLFL